MASLTLGALLGVLVASSVAAGAFCRAEEVGAGAPLEAPRPLRDRFRLIQSNVSGQVLGDEIQDFTSYGCERMVVIRNEAQDVFRVACASHNESPKASVVSRGNAYIFTFRPKKNGESAFWCTVDYQRAWARFDVYNEARSPYTCGAGTYGTQVTEFVVRHDGVYTGADEKIRSLLKGHNRYTLWEQFEDGQTDGMLMSGLVDGGECADLALHANDRTAAVSVCGHACVHLYEHFGCRGAHQAVQASEECHDFPLEAALVGKLSAVRGC